MNITSQATTITNATQEILLRTLKSDTSSLAKGNQQPIPEQLTAHFSSPADATAQPEHQTSWLRIFFALFLIIGIGLVSYYYIYLNLTGAIGPATL